jgi:hypothetical protein
MRIAMLAALAATSATSAAPGCMIPEKQLTPEGDPFGCLNQPLPATAKDPVMIAGTLHDPFSGTKISGAVVEGYQVGLSTRIFMTTSDAGGNFSQTQGTGTVPRNAYLRVAPNGYVPSYYYPAVPIANDIATQIQLFTMNDLGTLASAAQVTIDPTKAILAVTVTDCNGMPLGGAAVTTQPAGTVRYFDASATPSPTAVATDSHTGTALVVNVPPSNTTINAMVQGKTLRTHAIDAAAGALTQTEIQP